MATLIKNKKVEFTAKSIKTSSTVLRSNPELGIIDFYYNPERLIGEEWNNVDRYICKFQQCSNLVSIRRFGSDIVVAELPSDSPAIHQLVKNAETPMYGVKKIGIRDIKLKIERKEITMKEVALVDEDCFVKLGV